MNARFSPSHRRQVGFGLLGCLAWAGCGLASATPRPEVHQFIISALLRHNAQGHDLQLIHGVMPGRSKEEAVGVMMKRLRTDYAAYSVMLTVTSQVGVAGCQSSGISAQVVPRGSGHA
jgi:hypothetical protein